MGFNSKKDYEIKHVKNMGFNSIEEYRKYLEDKRKGRKKNKIFSRFLRKRLTETGMNKYQLSKKINISREAVSKYTEGKMIPKKELLKRIFLALDVPYKTLEDLTG